jgi:hypothetical protein
MNSHACKFQLHTEAHLLSGGGESSVSKPEPAGSPSLYRKASTKAEQVERWRREVESCRRAGEDPNLSPAEKLGAMQGEVDWLAALQIAEEE